MYYLETKFAIEIHYVGKVFISFVDAIHDLDWKKIQIGDAIRYLENLEGKCSLRY